MAKYSPEQIAMVAWNAGVHDEPTLTRAVAVAMGESGGNTNAHNPDSSTGDDSYGLWQINMLGSLGPARRKQFGIKTNAELFDPQKNAHAMWKISNGGKNWAPWSVFKNGSYAKHIPAAKKAAASVVGKARAASPNPATYAFPILGVVGAAADAAEDARGAVAGALDVPGAITGAVNGALAGLLKMGMNAGAVLIAVVLLILGVVILLRSPLKKAAGVAASVVPGGGVAKVAGKAAKVL